MKRTAVFALLMSLALPLAVARADWRVGFSFGGPYRPYGRVFIAPAPIYVRPAAVYYAPAPVYLQPAPIYLQSVPVQPVYQLPPVQQPAGSQYQYQPAQAPGTQPTPAPTQPTQQYLPPQPVPVYPG